MSVTPKLVFFNKEGYPYNFTLNDGIWTGKIFFEPNSTELFKNISLYTLENVSPIEINDEFDIESVELFNESGMTLSNGGYENEIVTNIVSVNDSPDFYTKWIYGDGFDNKFPVGTVISFSGNIGSFPLASDFSDDFFTVLRTIRNAIMISTETNNEDFDFDFTLGTPEFYVTSHNCISVLDPQQSLNTFDIGDRLSIVGTQQNNDGVYELIDTGYTMTNIFDYNLSGSTSYGDNIRVELTLLTERPLLYIGQISMEYDGTDLYFTFVEGRNSNLSVGTNFICEDENWNHLLGGNQYEILSIVTEEDIVTESVSFIKNTYEQDDGTKGNDFIVRLSDDFGIQPGWRIRFDFEPLSLSTPQQERNNRLVKRVIDVKVYNTHCDIYLDSDISEIQNVNYRLTRLLKIGEQNTVIVQPSISNITFNDFAKVMNTSNVLTFNQNLPSNGTDIYTDTINSIDIFINRFQDIFRNNGIDIYRKDDEFIFEGMYGGKSQYFGIGLFRNNTFIPIEDKYSNGSETNLLHLVLKENSITYERLNMSVNYNQPFYADIVFNLFDDVQDYGFELDINGVQYYISFNDDSGTTSNTYETILDFIDKYQNALYKNGIDIYSNRILVGSEYEEHLYIVGQKSNVVIWDLRVNVNRNSSYEIVNRISNNYMLISSNKLISTSLDFIELGFATGMILSINGSSYPLNNKEYNIIGLNIIGLNNTTITLSYQGPMNSENNVELLLKSRDYLRRPRESNVDNIYYRYRWEDDQENSMFLYDLSGENLVPWGNNPLYEYTGPKPLSVNGDLVFLNKEPNKNVDYVNIPYKQQTIFKKLDFKLQTFSDIDASILPNPIQTFIGYNNKKEGVHQRNLIIERVDNVSYKGETTGTNMYFVTNNDTIYMYNSNTNFLDLGFKTNRYLRIKFFDKKPYTQSIFENYNDYYILDVTENTIKVSENLLYFSTEDEDFNFEFILLPERIAFLRLYGETESEDDRLRENNKLLGISLTEEDEFIFKQSDISEDGIDYRLLNRKRKEMMNVFPEIYNYIGSYRAILNSINFFGYDDIRLTEYFRNINPESPYYNKLKRVVIPDLLERQDDDWVYEESIPDRMEYVKTSLLNLTYRITDERGNNVLLYSLKDVQIKLNGLKKWLRRNVIPINSNIRDITGVSEAVGIKWRRFDPGTNFTKNITSQKNEAVNINYTATKNFNDQWLVSVRFYTISGEIPDYWRLKVITFKKELESGILYPQQRWDIFKTDLSNFNFSLNWDANILGEDDYDRFFYVETTSFNDFGVAKTVNKMYRLEDGERFYFDEFKNYTLVNNNFKYKTFPYVQNQDFVYIIDENGNFWIIDKEVQSNR